MQSSVSNVPKVFIHIKPPKGWRPFELKEFKQYKDLFYFLMVRDIKVKYKQTVLGGLWAIIQPLFSMVVFTLFFGKLAKVPSDGVPYPIFSFTAMVAWTYFSNSLAGSGNSLVGSQNLISKVYFPRLFIPLTPIAAGLLDFLIAFVILLAMMVYFGILPTYRIMVVPFLVLLMALTASGVGAILAALNARYRDIKYVIPFLVQLWMFSSPIVYPSSIIPGKYKWIYALNPMVGVIEGFRSALLGTIDFPYGMVFLSSLLTALIFVGGIIYFRKAERFFADVI